MNEPYGDLNGWDQGQPITDDTHIVGLVPARPMKCPPLLAISSKALPSTHGHADWHWRIARPFARLAEQGVDTATCWFDDDQRPTVSPAGRVVILQRVVKSGTESEVRAWVQSLRDAGALAVVFEIDDDELSPAVRDWMEAAGGLESVGRARLESERQSLTWTMQACDAVTVSTDPLADVARRYTSAPVHVIPNAIDVQWFRERLKTPAPWADTLTIGWAGGRRPDADLEPMAMAWGRIAKRYPDVRFVVAGWQPDVIYREVEDIDRIIRVPWQSLDDYPAAMRVDIGCCPLEDTPFNRCKSPIKAWEYALAGAAVVASPTVYELCIDGAPGDNWTAEIWLSETAAEWEANIADLIEHPGWRDFPRRIVAAHTRKYHSLTASLPNWVRAYSEIAAVTV